MFYCDAGLCIMCNCIEYIVVDMLMLNMNDEDVCDNVVSVMIVGNVWQVSWINLQSNDFYFNYSNCCYCL